MQSQDRETLFAALPPPWPDEVLPAIQQTVHRVKRSVFVLDDDGQLVGMLSELDCLKAIVERIYTEGQSSACYVYEVMTRDVETNKPGDDIISVAASMLENKRRRRPVVGADGLAGQITCRQILGAIQEFRLG